jgi:hypothetical protein
MLNFDILAFSITNTNIYIGANRLVVILIMLNITNIDSDLDFKIVKYFIS